MPFIDRTVLDFLLYDWLDAAALTKLPRFSEHSRETFDAVLDLSARLADEHFAPHAKQSDRNEPVFDGETVHVLPDIKTALRVYAEAGLFAATFDEALSGAQIPALIHTASTALTMAANIATAAYPMLTVAMPASWQASARRAKSRPSRVCWSKAAGSAACVCRSRRPARRSRTSPQRP
jgi:alkylation response protein AidB-like acyl-CoA dehydrogenase